MNQWKDKIDSWRGQLDVVVSGYPHVKDQVIVAVLAKGHVLLRAVPGTAKTTLANTLTKSIEGARGARYQMTPDMKPGDIIGVEVYNQKTGAFDIRKGKLIGANIVLCDELNRTIPKTQSALLEAMQEGRVTVASDTYQLEDLAFVIATMNPVEQEGTYPLPEAQLDRFAFLLDMRYVSREDEIAMAMNDQVHGRDAQANVKPAVSVADILEMRKTVDAIAKGASRSVIEYIVDLVRATRPGFEANEKAYFDKVHGTEAKALRDKIELGCSPRAIIWTKRAAAAHAFVSGNDHITPDDVKAVFRDVARHRILLNAVAEQDGFTTDQVIDAVLNRVPVIEPKGKK
jgi:MoxR-like ATPase